LNGVSTHEARTARATDGREVEAGGMLTVDLGALVHNWRLLDAASGSAECAAVVKADGYGIGLTPAVETLAAAGCRTFFVAHLAEAARARKASPGTTIYVLNGLLPGTAAAYVPDALRPTLGSPSEIAEWASFCRDRAQALPAAIHVDTGMNRLGLRPEEAAILAADAPTRRAFTISLLMSHFASSEVVADAANARQIATFDRVRALFRDIPASLCNSSGIFLPQRPHLDMVRPGYALYGGNPTPGAPNPMQAVIRLEARVIQLRDVQAGETVGYNCQWTAPRACRIAVLSVGYADGFPRAASATDAKSGGIAIVAGQRCPFAGRVSMDLITVDVTDTPAGAVKPGDLVTLVGDDLGIDEVGSRAGTIGYEVLTSLGRRYARRYVRP
jgi:alanine racemase